MAARPVPQALVLHWKAVLAHVPEALLVLAGATSDRDYVGHLRQLARGLDGDIRKSQNARKLRP